MYGMVNEGIRTFVLKAHDEETWLEICQAAGAEQTEFERMSTYDDRLTYDLVHAICTKTGLTAEDALKAYGKYFVEFAGATHFGNLMRLSGDTLVERLRGLDELHDRITLSMPHLKPPSFELEHAGPGVYHLYYESQREGLAPMVIGLIHGIAEETGERIEVAHIASKSETGDHDLFEIRLLTDG